jgi:hypothetical protein
MVQSQLMLLTDFTSVLRRSFTWPPALVTAMKISTSLNPRLQRRICGQVILEPLKANSFNATLKADNLGPEIGKKRAYVRQPRSEFQNSLSPKIIDTIEFKKLVNSRCPPIRVAYREDGFGACGHVQRDKTVVLHYVNAAKDMRENLRDTD